MTCTVRISVYCVTLSSLRRCEISSDFLQCFQEKQCGKGFRTPARPASNKKLPYSDAKDIIDEIHKHHMVCPQKTVAMSYNFLFQLYNVPLGTYLGHSSLINTFQGSLSTNYL